MRILITGGAGFIGSHVADALVGRGHDVAVFDSLVAGNRSNVNAAATFFQGDITNPGDLDHAFDAFRPEAVNHQAAQVSVSVSTADPLMDAQTNVIGSLQVLEACRRFDVLQFVFASTGGALYGDPAHLPASEETPIEPLSPYGAAKAAVEVYLFTYARTWGLRAVALRYANVFGPRQSPHGEAGVIAIFAAKMLAGQAPVVFGDGDQERDFVYVSDVAAANVAALERSIEGAFNVGTGRATSVNEIMRLIAAEAGFRGEARHEAARPGEVRRITLDATKLMQTVGWKAAVSLEEGIEKTVEEVRRMKDEG